MEWIKAKDRIPEHTDELILYYDGTVFCAWFELILLKKNVLKRMKNNCQKKTYSKLIFPTSGEILYEEIPEEEGKCRDTRIYSYYDGNTKSSGIFIVRKTLKEAKSVMLECLKKDIENNKAEGIRLKAEYKKLKQWDVTHGSIKK